MDNIVDHVLTSRPSTLWGIGWFHRVRAIRDQQREVRTRAR
jgi:hypothetical protein